MEWQAHPGEGGRVVAQAQLGQLGWAGRGSRGGQDWEGQAQPGTGGGGAQPDSRASAPHIVHTLPILPPTERADLQDGPLPSALLGCPPATPRTLPLHGVSLLHVLLGVETDEQGEKEAATRVALRRQPISGGRGPR